MSKKYLVQILAITLTAVCVGACARTVVRPETEIRNFGLPRPERIVVYDFAITEAELTESLGSITDETSGTSEVKRNHEMGRQAANALAEELLRELRDFGFAVERRPRSTPIGSHQLLIDGMFLDVD